MSATHARLAHFTRLIGRAFRWHISKVRNRGLGRRLFSIHCAILSAVCPKRFLSKVPLPGGLVLGVSLWSKTETEDEKEERKIKEIIEKADSLYDAYLIELLYQHLKPYRDGDNPELLWRLARATCDMAKLSSNAKERKALMLEAFRYAQKALEFGEHLWPVHKWFAILFNYTGEYEGTRERLLRAPLVKRHLERAVELNPLDATTWHILGVWCYTFADLPWYQRKLAAAVFASPPESSYAEAARNFLKAETISPNFYSQNLLYLGKVNAKLERYEIAREYLEKTIKYVVVSADDRAAHKEAEELMASLPK